jgi:hypothetical protein
MPWTPSLYIIRPRVIADNILSYCTDATRQRDALNWALGSTSTQRLIATVPTINITKTLPRYPSVEFSDDNDQQVFGEDILQCLYTVQFNFAVQAATAATALSNARLYDAAWRSMMVNCPSATLSANSGATAGTAQILGIETGFLVIQAGNQGKATADFLQRFEIKVEISMTGAAK